MRRQHSNLEPLRDFSGASSLHSLRTGCDGCCVRPRHHQWRKHASAARYPGVGVAHVALGCRLKLSAGGVFTTGCLLGLFNVLLNDLDGAHQPVDSCAGGASSSQQAAQFGPRAPSLRRLSVSTGSTTASSPSSLAPIISRGSSHAAGSPINSPSRVYRKLLKVSAVDLPLAVGIFAQFPTKGQLQSTVYLFLISVSDL